LYAGAAARPAATPAPLQQQNLKNLLQTADFARLLDSNYTLNEELLQEADQQLHSGIQADHNLVANYDWRLLSETRNRQLVSAYGQVHALKSKDLDIVNISVLQQKYNVYQMEQLGSRTGTSSPASSSFSSRAHQAAGQLRDANKAWEQKDNADLDLLKTYLSHAIVVLEGCLKFQDQCLYVSRKLMPLVLRDCDVPGVDVVDHFGSKNFGRGGSTVAGTSAAFQHDRQHFAEDGLESSTQGASSGINTSSHGPLLTTTSGLVEKTGASTKSLTEQQIAAVCQSNDAVLEGAFFDTPASNTD
ncbi:unnamed protein product, partial [Amoebophrya sp. A120]